MIYLYSFTFLLAGLSFFFDRRKTREAVRTGIRDLIRILPSLTAMIIIVSILLSLVSDKLIMHSLANKNPFFALLFAMLFGSITIMPGFIVFPLCSILLKKGVSYMVLSALSTTLMMVGIATFPLEREYLGTKIAIIRNLLGLVIAATVAFVMGIFFKELF